MHSTGTDAAVLARIRRDTPLFTHPQEFSNTAAVADELLCSTASIAAHIANIYSRVNFLRGSVVHQ